MDSERSQSEMATFYIQPVVYNFNRVQSFTGMTWVLVNYTIAFIVINYE